MKALYVLQDNNFFSHRTNIVGGHIAHIIGVVEALQRLGHEVVIASFDRVPYWDNSDIRYFQFKVTDIPIPKVRRVITHWRMKKQLIRAVLEEKPELIYIRWSGHISRDISKAFPNLPIVMECNTAKEMPLGLSHPSLHRKWLAHRVDKINTKSATLISAVSIETKDFLLEHHPELDPLRVIVNPNGVDVNRFCYTESGVRDLYNIPHDAIVIAYAGNFLTFHRIDLLIKAFQQLDLAGVYLLIIGTGPLELCNTLKRMAANRRESQIIFTDAVPFDQMPQYLSACDILVSPQSQSIAGKFHQSPIKLYEYMAVGRAIVGSNIGQISEVIENGRNGLLFEPDSLEGLADALKQLIENPSLRLRLGQQARYDAERLHSWEANVQRIFDGLKRLGYSI